MLLFKRKYNLKESNLLYGFVDIHSHILPCVDDGFSNKEESVDALCKMAEYGVKEIWLTPHVMHEIAENDKQTLIRRYESFMIDNKSTIKLNLAAEYMIDSYFLKLQKERLLCFSKNYVLVENSYYAPYNEWEHVMFELRLDGYELIIAHPERYLYMDHQMYDKLKGQKYKFQLDLFSIMGYYGKVIKERTIYLLEHGMYDFAGSDVHDYRTWENAIHEKCLSMSQIKELERIFQNNKTL